MHADIRAGLDEAMHAARAGFDAVGLTEHGQSSYDMDPNPDLGAAALAYQIGAEDLNTGIYVVGRSLGKTPRAATGRRRVGLAGQPVGRTFDDGIPRRVAL